MLRQKYFRAEDITLGLLIPASFYKICREALSVTHEFFSDSITQSGELGNYCSLDLNDQQYGSAGEWDKIEEQVDGAAGFPSLEAVQLDELMDRIEINMMAERPYCRILCVPVYEGSRLEKSLRDDLSIAEVLVTIPKEYFHCFRHRFDMFREGYPAVDILLQLDEKTLEDSFNNSQSPSFISIVIWMNQSYRMKYKVPRDVTECFLAWSASTFGTVSVVNRKVFGRVFPLALRSWRDKEDMFHTD